MKMPCSLLAELFFENEKKARAAFLSVRVELGQKFEKRAKTTMDINKNVVSLKIIAMDSRALKASVNSYIKLFFLSENFMEVL